MRSGDWYGDSVRWDSVGSDQITTMGGTDESGRIQNGEGARAIKDGVVRGAELDLEAETEK